MKKIFCAVFLIFSSAFLFAERPLVHDIQARPGNGTKMIISWKVPQNTEPEILALYLYRTSKQVTSYEQIKDLDPIAELEADRASYTDTLEDLSNYYYTVISRTTTGTYDVILRSFNTTVTGVHLIAKKSSSDNSKKAEPEITYPDGTLRRTPLPTLGILEGINAEPLVSNKAASDVSTLTKGSSKVSKTPLLTPYIFEEDQVSPDGGDDYLLFEILKTSFVTRKYAETIDKIKQLVGTNINEQTRNRAYFYLGEAQYFNFDYDEAVKSFVRVQQIYPTLSKKWLEDSLDRL